MHLLEDNGMFIMSYENFWCKFHLNDRRQYDIVVKAIPQATIVSACSLYQRKVTPCLPNLLINGYDLTSKKLV